MSAFPNLALPPFVLTDSYKLSHNALYPDARLMTAYGEFRQSYNKDPIDHRIVVYGVRYLIDNYIAKKWTAADLVLTDNFAATHNAAFSPFPFPVDLFRDMIAENDGYFPVTIHALPEGSVVYPHVPVFQITAKDKYARLVTYLETLLTMIWYPSTVATLSRRCKHSIAQSFIRTVDGAHEQTGDHPLLASRLHDFGFRGCTSVEQAVIGGSAHLLNFEGSDTLAACYYAQYHDNAGQPVATSIPATEHSVMTAWPTEREAMVNALEKFGHGVVACVMDSYDYVQALEKVLPSIKSKKLASGGFLVLRPDSGNPVETVLQALRAAESTFGSVVNKKGYKVPIGVGVIQGDGISDETLVSILKEVEREGFSAQAVAFGMGGGLLQKVNRDTMSFATKLNHIVYADGTEREVMKVPKTDAGKTSLPGKLTVVIDERGLPMVYPADHCQKSRSLLQLVYDGTDASARSKSFHWESFNEVRKRVEREWHARPLQHDPLSLELKEKQKKVADNFRKPIVEL